MLENFRQLPTVLGRTLLGMLLFVWLTMALAPCVMATEMPFFDSDAVSSAVHDKMEHCSYCPDAKDTMNAMVLCQNAHANTPDSMSLAVDVVDVESFVLFEIPVALQSISLLASNSSFNFHETPPPVNRFSPLVMTGLLRI